MTTNPHVYMPTFGRTFRVMDHFELDERIDLGMFPESVRGCYVLVDWNADVIVQCLHEGRNPPQMFHVFNSKEEFDEIVTQAA